MTSAVEWAVQCDGSPASPAATVVCLNNNKQQLEEARRRNLKAGLDHKAEYLECNFMDMSIIEANSFDAGYAIESTCHAPDKQRAFFRDLSCA